MRVSESRIPVSFGTHLKLEKGTPIFSEGQKGSEMYVIMSGRVRIFLSSGNRSLTLTKLKKGDFFGEMALLEELPRSAGAEAITNVELIAIGKEDFKFLIQQHPDIAMKVLAKFSRRLRDADHLIGLLLMGDDSGRILHTLVKQAVLQHDQFNKLPKEWFLPISIKELAELSDRPEKRVEKILHELARIGIIVLGNDGIVIKKHKKLNYYMDYLGWRGKI